MVTMTKEATEEIAHGSFEGCDISYFDIRGEIQAVCRELDTASWGDNLAEARDRIETNIQLLRKAATRRIERDKNLTERGKEIKAMLMGMVAW